MGAALNEAAFMEHTVVRLGVLMAEAGAAAFRVQGSMQRAARSLGADAVGCLIVPEGIVISLTHGGDVATEVVRLGGIGVNMWRVRELDALSRRLAESPGRLPASEVHRALDEIEKAKPCYPRWLTVPLLGAACAAFCGAMRGTPPELVAAFGGAALGHVWRLLLHARRFQVVPLVVSSAFVASLASFVLAKALVSVAAPLGFGAVDPVRAMLAAVLYLIPGVPLVTSLLDVIHGDLQAGIARAAFATMVIACIAVGILTSFFLVGFTL